MSFNELINKLPQEIIIHHICPYLYLPQSKKLCHDIKSFVLLKIIYIILIFLNIHYINAIVNGY